jgi:hypothetical protein
MLGGSAILFARFVALVGGGTAEVPVSALENADCVRCHEVQASEWEASQHRAAFTESTFQTAHALEPLVFCRGCHAPEADPRRVDASAGALGVACVTCHVRDDAVVAGPGESATGSPHAIVRDPAFATTAACASCHQFEFPDAELRDDRELMQSTIEEHATSRFAERSCTDCHMPREADGHRSHAFAASRDAAMLRSAVDVSAERTDADTITVTLRAGRVGHAFPTGDLLRRIEVGASVEGGVAVRRFLARHFGRQRQRSGIVLRGEIADDRVPADGTPRRVRLRVPGSGGEPVRWWVTYQRVAHQTSFHERDAAIDGEVQLAGGVLRGVHE